MYARFKDYIYAADLTELGSWSSKNRGVYNVLCVIDVFTDYARAKPLTDKKGKTVVDGVIEIVKYLIVNQIKFSLVKEVRFIITIYKKGWTLKIF